MAPVPSSLRPEEVQPPAVAAPTYPVLLVDDDLQFLFSASVMLRSAGLSPVTISNSREVIPYLSSRDVSVIVLDLTMPELSGTELLPRIREEFPQVPVIISTGVAETETVVTCMKAGAFDYLTKPVERSRFVSSIRRAIELRVLQQEVALFQEHLLSLGEEGTTRFHGIVTRNRKMRAIFRYVSAVARSRQPVLITGETGAGKELVAKAIHEVSGSAGSFVAVNVAGLDDTMFSDTLFGHRKGAYTGADQDREGLISRASGGTLFLDEVGDLEKRSQVKLLRLLEENEYLPLGSDDPRATDARILCATHHSLNDFVAKGEFRKDLFYRLNAHHVHIPPLRERREDIPLLLDRYLEEAAQSLGKKKPTPPPELLKVLAAYDFPGNVRELKAMIHDAVAQHESGVLSLKGFRRVIGESRTAGTEIAESQAAREGSGFLRVDDHFPTLREAEEYLIAEALKRAGENQGAAALLLGISREALNKRLARRKRPPAGGEPPQRAA